MEETNWAILEFAAVKSISKLQPRRPERLPGLNGEIIVVSPRKSIGAWQHFWAWSICPHKPSSLWPELRAYAANSDDLDFAFGEGRGNWASRRHPAEWESAFNKMVSSHCTPPWIPLRGLPMSRRWARICVWHGPIAAAKCWGGWASKCTPQSEGGHKEEGWWGLGLQEAFGASSLMSSALSVASIQFI